MTIILTDSEKASAAAEVGSLITASGRTATLLRKQSGEVLYGSDEGEFTEVCTFALELCETPAADIAQTGGCDLQVFCLGWMFAWRTVFVSRVETIGCRQLRRSRSSAW